MSDDDWRDRDRDEPLVRLLHLPRGLPADDEEARRARSSTSRRSSACTATGARRTTPPRRPGSSASRSRSPGSSAAAASARTSSRPGYVKTQLTDVLPEEATTAMLDEHAARPARRAGGHRGGGTLPLLRRGLVHHGRGAARRRGTGNVDAQNGSHQRAAACRHHRAGRGHAARQRRRDDVGAPARGRVAAPARSRSSTTRASPCTSRAR